jgi:hypothetical protein
MALEYLDFLYYLVAVKLLLWKRLSWFGLL